MARESIGWIGLGNIGLPMARRVVQAGYEVTICGHARREPVDELKRLGAREAATPDLLARASDVGISIVRDVHQTEEILLGLDGLWAGFHPGQLLVLSSTLPPDFC